MKNLAIDTSSKICSVAILENDALMDEINLDNGKTHSENLMPIVAEILEKNELKLSDMDLISCSVGPGSFTGIRIGVASVKAMAEINNILIASVTSLEILARIDESEKNKVALIDARNNQVYCGIFDKRYQKLEKFMADDIDIIINNLKKYENSVFIGDGAVLHKDKIIENIPNAEFSKENDQSAKCCGLIGYQKYLANDLQTSDSIVPLYLRKSQAERLKSALKSSQIFLN